MATWQEQILHAQEQCWGARCIFAYALQLRGQDKNGTGMELSLSADATVPPQAVGGCYDYGQLTIYGQPRTHSYYRLLRYSGRLRWGRGESPIDEPVHGQIGWLDRQWFPDYVGTYDGPLADHYGHEWIQLSLSNGWQMALWRQFDRHRQDALVPFSGLTVTDPDGRTVFVDEAGYDIDITTYLRDPGEIEPLLSKPQVLAGIRSPIRYFFDAYRLRVPSLGLDVSSIPMVPAPAHTMPVDYFNGPTQLQGTISQCGATVFMNARCRSRDPGNCSSYFAILCSICRPAMSIRHLHRNT